jgi:hypothetical protein
MISFAATGGFGFLIWSMMMLPFVDDDDDDDDAAAYLPVCIAAEGFATDEILRPPLPPENPEEVLGTSGACSRAVAGGAAEVVVPGP